MQPCSCQRASYQSVRPPPAPPFPCPLARVTPHPLPAKKPTTAAEKKAAAAKAAADKKNKGKGGGSATLKPEEQKKGLFGLW